MGVIKWNNQLPLKRKGKQHSFRWCSSLYYSVEMSQDGHKIFLSLKIIHWTIRNKQEQQKMS